MFDYSFLPILLALLTGLDQADSGVLSSRYTSIQAAIDANPGTVIEIPASKHEIVDTIVIKSGGGLTGSATVVQTNPGKAIGEIDHSLGTTLRGLTLTRPEGRRETRAEAVIATDSADLDVGGSAGDRQSDPIRDHRAEELF